MARLNPYISFADNARQAMEFYKGVFGGNLKFNTYGEYGQAGTPEADNIMHGQLDAPNGMTLMGADSPPATEHNPGNNIAISLSGEDVAELHGYWDQLAAGGSVSVPLEKQMWGDEFDMCTDQFGITWMINIGPEPEQ